MRPASSASSPWMNAFERWSIAMLVVSLATVPFCLWATTHVLGTNTNKVEDWLPVKFPETQTVLWFQKYFKGDEVLIVSWPGCTLDDTRLDTLAESARKLTDPRGQPLFRRIYTGRSLLDVMQTEPLRLSRKLAIERLSGWGIGQDRETTCAILMMDSTVAPDRNRGMREIERIAIEECHLDRAALKVGGPTADCVFIDRVSANSLYVLSSISVVLGVLMAWWFLRNGIMVCAAFATALLSELYSLTIIYLSGTHMDAVLTMVPLLVYVLTICASIHYLNAYRQALIAHPKPQFEAFALAWKPTALAAMTTSLGLASLMVSELVPIRKFGLFGALGILVSVPVVFVFMTSFLTVFPCKRPVSPNGEGPKPSLRWDLVVSRISMNHASLVLVISVIGLLVLGIGAARILSSTKIRDMFTDQSRELNDYRWLEANVASLVPVNVVLCFGPGNSSTMLERLEMTDQIRARIAEVPLISGVAGPSTFLPVLRSSAGMRGVVQRSVVNNKLRMQRLALVDSGMLADSPDEELWLVTARAPMFCPIDYGQLATELESKVNDWLRSLPANMQTDVRAVVCGGVPVITSVQTRLLLDLKSSLGMSLLTIGGLLAIALRSLRAACLLLIPNVLPVVIIFGIMGWAGIAVNLGSMMTISTAIGIAVDNELHFISWYQRLIREGESRETALWSTLEHCGEPIVQSAWICGLGMVVLMFSPFQPTVLFGGIMCLLIACAVVGDLVILPALLIGPLGKWFTGKQPDQPPSSDQTV